MGRRMLTRIVAISIVLAAVKASPASAEPSTSLTIEPLYLVLPMISLTGEHELAPHVGLAIIAGYGHPIFGSLYELGGHANYYVQRRFTGWHLGAELDYMWGDTALEPFVGSSQSTGAERVVGAYGGYKWCASYGLTAIIEFGIGHYDAPDLSKLGPVANFTVGWSW